MVIHRALWCTSYRNDGEVLPFPPDRLKLCQLQNDMLEQAYDRLERAFDGREQRRWRTSTATAVAPGLE